ncbi:MAG TPA: hypothetical protein VGL70_06375 [Candidatus Binatia bacterium]|jgi:hypothetical protein
MKKARLLVLPLLLGLLIMSGCVSAGVDIGGHGASAGAAPGAAGVEVH